MSEPAWSPAPGRFSPAPGEVHVWRFALDPAPEVVARLDAALDDAEQARRDRYRTAPLRRRFSCGRGGLRTLLAAYTATTPRAVRFAYGIHGKPSLAYPEVGLQFNLAHTAETALCALAWDRILGVDVEAVRPMESAEKIVDRFFSPAERAEFFATPEADRVAAFFRGWSRKEAFLKAKGTGLQTALHSFDVTLAPDRPAVLRVGDDPAEPARWSLVDLDPGPAFAAALAASVGAPGEHVPIRLFDEAGWDGFPLA